MVSYWPFIIILYRNKIMKKKQVICWFILLFILACKNQDTNENTDLGNDTVDNYENSTGRSFTYDKYKLPISVDIYKFLKKKNVPFNKKYLLDLNKKDRFFTTEQRALALGIYSSDLVNAAVYEINQEAVNYLGVSIDISNKLDIIEGYNSSFLDRANHNLDNNDSLIQIASEAYMRTCKVLERMNRNNILPLIVLGSWIESIHFLVRNSAGSNASDELYKELYNQKETLDNIIIYFNDINVNSDSPDLKKEMKKWLIRLRQIQGKYNEIDISKGNDQFKNVIFQIEGLRMEITE
jgi:hypothetical protein